MALMLRGGDNAGMRLQRRSFDSWRLALLLGIAALAAVPARAASRKSPYVEMVGEATVVTKPRQTVHKNGRKFLEFEITLSSARPAADQPSGADRNLRIDTTGRVRVIHDLSCGGGAIDLEVGDRIDIGGEYVHVPKGGDLIHFTHPADGSCGRGGAHPAGFLKKAAAPKAPPPTPRPASLVPAQPYTGTPTSARQPYEAILAAREQGVSNTELLARVERENTVYSLSTFDIQKLRSAGVSGEVIEAMMRSGRLSTSAPAPAEQPAPATPR
jgi:hypothetical protein